MRLLPESSQRHGFAAGLSICALLIAVFSLTYSGTFITDDEHLLAARTLGLAFDGDPNDARVFGNSRVFGLAESPGLYAAQGTNIEPMQAVIGATLARLSAWLGAGRVQTLFLLNIWVTALTAAVLFGIVGALGFSRGTAAVVALLFGLGTIAWPYSRTYFRDPLAMLFLALAWACALAAARGGALHARLPRWLTWAALAAALLAGVLTKNTVLTAVPVLAVYLPATRWRVRGPDALRQHWKGLAAGLAAGLLLLGAWAALVPPDGALARFSLRYYLSVLEAVWARPHGGFFEALSGPIFSPGKSIFLYSPALLLALNRRRPDLAWPAWTYLLLLIAAQTLFYDLDWWGHINWGLRFTLPAVPLLMIAAAPVIEDWLGGDGGRRRLLALGALSVLVQLVGVLAPVREFYVSLSSAAPPVPASAAIWDLRHSPLIWHVQWIASGKLWDLAAVRLGAAALPVVAGLALGAAFVLWSGVRCWAWVDGRVAPSVCRGAYRDHRPSPNRLAVLASAVVIAAFSLSMPMAYRDDPAYFRTRVDLADAAERLRAEHSQGDVVIVKSYGAAAWNYWMNWGPPEIRWHALPFAHPAPALLEEYFATRDPEPAMDRITLALLNDAAGSGGRVWLVLPDDSPGSILDLEVNWLEARAESSSIWAFPGDGVLTRLALFEFAGGGE